MTEYWQFLALVTWTIASRKNLGIILHNEFSLPAIKSTLILEFGSLLRCCLVLTMWLSRAQRFMISSATASSREISILWCSAKFGNVSTLSPQQNRVNLPRLTSRQLKKLLGLTKDLADNKTESNDSSGIWVC